MYTHENLFCTNICGTSLFSTVSHFRLRFCTTRVSSLTASQCSLKVSCMWLLFQTIIKHNLQYLKHWRHQSRWYYCNSQVLRGLATGYKIWTNLFQLFQPIATHFQEKNHVLYGCLHIPHLFAQLTLLTEKLRYMSS